MLPEHPAVTTTTTTTPPPVEIDPANPGTPVRVELAIESVFNLALAVPLLLAPAPTFQRLFSPDGSGGPGPSPSPTPAPEALALAQAYAVLILGATVGMVLAVLSRPGAVEWRRMSYATLLATEAVYAPLAFWQAALGFDATGLEPRKLVWSTGVPMCVLGAWRAWCFIARPGWFGGYRVRGAVKRE